MTTTRRSFLRSALWSAPAVVVATAAPAFARSVVQPPSKASCVLAVQRIRRPGKSKSRPWVYMIQVACTLPVRFVFVNGKPVQKPRAGGSIYTAVIPKCLDVVTVSVVTREGTVTQVVRVS